MKMKSNVLLLLIILVSCLSFNSCITYKEIEFNGVRDVGIGSLNSQVIPIELMVNINNPNNYNIKITRANLDIYLEGKHFGKSEIKDKIVIVKKEEKNYSITLETSKSKIGKSLFSSISMLFGKSISLEVKGTVTAKAFGIKKKFPIHEKQQLKPSDFMK